MSCNVKLLERIHECEEEYGSISAAPDLGPIHEVADREPQRPSYIDKTLKLRELISRGFTTMEISNATGLNASHVSSMKRKMRRSPDFEYKSTRDDLVQVKYNFDHGGRRASATSVSGAMHRDRAWVSAMVGVLRKSGWRMNYEDKRAD